MSSVTGMTAFVQLFVDRCLGYINEISNSFALRFCAGGRLSISTGRETVSKKTRKKSSIPRTHV